MVQFTTSINLLGEPGGVEKIRDLWRAHGTLHADLDVTKAQFNVSPVSETYSFHQILNRLYLSIFEGGERRHHNRYSRNMQLDRSTRNKTCLE